MEKQKYDNSKYEYVNSIGKQIMDEGEWMPIPIRLHGEVAHYLGRFEGVIFFYMLSECFANGGKVQMSGRKIAELKKNGYSNMPSRKDIGSSCLETLCRYGLFKKEKGSNNHTYYWVGFFTFQVKEMVDGTPEMILEIGANGTQVGNKPCTPCEQNGTQGGAKGGSQVGNKPCTPQTDQTPTQPLEDGHYNTIQDTNVGSGSQGGGLFELNRDAWEEFEAYRLGKKKLSTMGAKKAINLLRKFDQATQQKMVDNTIMNEWVGLFEVKGGSSYKQQEEFGGGIIGQQF